MELGYAAILRGSYYSKLSSTQVKKQLYNAYDSAQNLFTKPIPTSLLENQTA